MWNNPTNNGGAGLSNTGFALLDRSGAASGAIIDYTSGFSTFNSNGWGSQNRDWVMMEGWFGFRATESITVNNLPAGYATEYAVIVYGDSNASNRTMHYTLDDGSGPATATIQDSGTFSGSFSERDHFVTFTGLTGSSFTLTGNPGSSDSRSAVNGLVIVPGTLPEPPVINSLTADDHYVSPGSSAQLSWSVDGADTITIDNGIGDVTGLTSTLVTVNAITTFTLTASNADGTTMASLRVGAGPPRPNLVFFMVDDMGWQDTSEPFLYDSMGAEVITALNQRYRTPNMELLAARGMKFTNAYAMPVCTPTRNCLMTGKNSARHLVTNWTNPGGTETGNNTTASHNSPTAWLRGGLPDSEITLPSLLQGAGYRTITVGKSHLGATPYARDPLNVRIRRQHRRLRDRTPGFLFRRLRPRRQSPRPPTSKPTTTPGPTSPRRLPSR